MARRREEKRACELALERLAECVKGWAERRGDRLAVAQIAAPATPDAVYCFNAGVWGYGASWQDTARYVVTELHVPLIVTAYVTTHKKNVKVKMWE